MFRTALPANQCCGDCIFQEVTVAPETCITESGTLCLTFKSNPQQAGLFLGFLHLQRAFWFQEVEQHSAREPGRSSPAWLPGPVWEEHSLPGAWPPTNKANRHRKAGSSHQTALGVQLEAGRWQTGLFPEDLRSTPCCPDAANSPFSSCSRSKRGRLNSLNSAEFAIPFFSCPASRLHIQLFQTVQIIKKPDSENV